MAITAPDPGFISFALNRFGYGPRPEDFTKVARQGWAGWVDEQLAVPVGDDPQTAKRLSQTKLHIKYNANEKWPAMDEMRPLDLINQPIESLWPLQDGSIPKDGAERNRPRDEVVAATLARAVYSPYQLREVMVAFWHDHFNVNSFASQQIAVALPVYDREVIRKYCFGNFREFLEAVATSTAMLYYLSNHSSRAGAANENYGRELFELHTLGRDAYLNDQYDRWRNVPGALQGHPTGYIDQDVYESARAFTGWTVEDGSGIDGQRKLPNTGKFAYVETWHDGYQKRVLAQDFDPFASAMVDGRKVLDLVASHPATTLHMATKLCRRFIGEDVPPALVQQVAEEWDRQAKSPQQIAKVVRMIALSPAFAASRDSKVKRPLALAASFARITDIDFTPTDGLANQLAAAGQRLFGYPTPTGLPDTNALFLGTNSMRQRWNIAWGLSQNAWGNGICQPSHVLPQNNSTAAAYAKRWLNVLGTEENNSLLTAMTGAIGLPPMTQLGSLDEKRLATLVAMAAMAPNFQAC